MCGIIACSQDFSDKKRSIQSSEDILSFLSHRGPDDSGLYNNVDKGIILGHTRLSILDLSKSGHQPMVSEDGEVVLVFNGEIYNFLELKEELQRVGCVFKSSSDTEVLLQLYLNYGEGMLSRLNGIFAFALWDARLGSMLVARDAFGVKPLYYAEENGNFICASEIKALLPLLSSVHELDLAALKRYLTFLWCPGKQTPLHAINKLEPGQALWVSDGRIDHQWTWFQLPVFKVPHDRLPLIRHQLHAIEETREKLRTAVYRQMIADVPIGAFLSGGLDSSAIVALAREKNHDIKCFTIETIGGSEAGFVADLPYARKVAKYLGLSLNVVRIDAPRMAGDLEWMVTQLDEPLADLAPLNVLYISKLARDQGIKVLLSGAGGDDLFTGYRRHRALMAERYWSWMPKFARAGLSRVSDALDQRATFGRRIAKLFSGAALDGDKRLVNYFRWIGEADLERFFSSDFRAAVNDSLAEAPMLEFLHDLPQKTTPLEKLLALEQRFFLADHNLLYTDKMSMAVGVEVRVPFLDLELVEFASRLPAHFKQRGKEGKWVLKKAMEPLLPKDVIFRPKTGFGVPLRRWMRHELRELLGDLLSTESLKRRGLFDPIAVQQLITSNDAGRVDASYTLLSLLCIEIWCRNFLDRRTIA